jgi:hypothetical protein
MPKTVNERLRGVGDRLSGIDRRLGYLVSKVFYRQQGYNPFNSLNYSWIELPVWKFVDNGFSTQEASDQDFMSQAQERSLTITINKTWWELNRDRLYDYDYGILVRPKALNERYVIASLTDAQAKDEDTFATLSLKEVKLV